MPTAWEQSWQTCQHEAGYDDPADLREREDFWALPSGVFRKLGEPEASLLQERDTSIFAQQAACHTWTFDMLSAFKVMDAAEVNTVAQCPDADRAGT